jgi:hypothetical protein
MRRADHTMNTVRVVTQTLVLVVACPASGAYVFRDFVDSHLAPSAHTLRQPSTVEAAAQARTVSRDTWRATDREAHYAEAPASVSLDLGIRHDDHATLLPLPSLASFDAPPSQRGPPAVS